MNRIRKEVLFFDFDWWGRYTFMVSLTPGSYQAWVSPKVNGLPHRYGGYHHPAEILLLKILTRVKEPEVLQDTPGMIELRGAHAATV